MTIGQTLSDSVDCSIYTSFITKAEKSRFVNEFKETANDILNYLMGVNFIPGVKPTEVNKIIRKMGETLKEMGETIKLPIYPVREEWRNGTLTMNPLVARLYYVEQGNTVQLTIDNRRGVERTVVIDDTRNNNDGELLGIGLYVPDFQYLTKAANLDDVVHMKYTIKKITPRVREARAPLRL